ncbi:MAG: non-canonical purine NTP pyrophosphatase [Paracoccaceae bacterium]|nr:MAG: non-canonical purine NTP pyrophosphatase [Paracoccaceae bacterium]
MALREIGNRLLVASHNAGKIAEMRGLLAPHGVTVVAAADLGLAEPAETEDSFEGNARLKAVAAAGAAGLPALADDSGLAVDALDGAPGVRTADWAETPSGRDFMLAMRRVHQALGERNAPQPWTARFVCVLCLAWPDGRTRLWRGEVPGRLIWPVRGRLGHGFDPMFVPQGDSRSFAEMTEAEKNRVSHRARAVAAFLREMAA